jgi:hypothetical protein
MNGSIFDKAILISVDSRNNDFLHSISQDLGKEFQCHTDQRDRSIIIDNLWRVFLGNKCDESSINALNIKITRVKIMTELMKFLFHNISVD